jgi:hypothetical protein
MGLEHDVGIIYVCAMCESYFVLDMTSVDYTEFRGREGTRQLEDYYMKLQTQYEQQRWAMQRCPTCIESATGKSYSDWLSSAQPAILSLCRAAVFEEGEPPPLYVQETAGRNRWSLAQGVGPKTLEMDRSRSGRLYKPALRGVISTSSLAPYSATEASGGAQGHAHMLDAVEAALARAARCGNGEADALAAKLVQCSPAFVNWDNASEVLAAAAAAAEAWPETADSGEDRDDALWGY